MKLDMGRSEQGISSDKYQVIPRVLIFVYNDQGEVLLIKGASTKQIWAEKYNGVGGHVERGEDILFAAKRELKEETGLESSSMFLCGQVMVDATVTTGITLFIFKAKYEGGALIPSAEGELEWVKPESFGELPLVEDLHTIIPKVSSMQMGDQPFFAKYAYTEDDQLVISFV